MTMFCDVQKEGALLVVTMNNPKKLNALGPTSHEEMASIFNDFEDDPKLSVAILTGAGRAFCSGSDISAYVAGTNKPLPPEGGGGLTHNHRLSKPVIAAVNGLAMGGGCEIALSCDMLVASENAYFGLPEPLVGAAALGGGLIQICRKLPYSVAMKVILTGDRLSAEEALRYGLISEVAPEGGALDAARKLAKRIMRCSPVALSATRQMARLALSGMPTAEIEKIEENVRAKVMASDDFKEGMAAFLDRREPVWTGH